MQVGTIVLLVLLVLLLPCVLVGLDWFALKEAQWSRGAHKFDFMYTHHAIYDQYEWGQGYRAWIHGLYPTVVAYRHKKTGQITVDPLVYSEREPNWMDTQ